MNFSEMTDLPSILSRRDTWRKAREALAAKDMPPDADDGEFPPADRARLLAWIDQRALTIDRQSDIYRDPGPSVVRQLTRVEYRNTMRDLLRIDFDAAQAAGIAPEDAVDRFANQAGGMVIDQTLLEKYFAGADAALDDLFDSGKNDGKHKEARAALLAPAAKHDDREGARRILQAFSHRAFRRPVDATEIDRLLPLFDQSLATGGKFADALRAAMKPILVSPHFLYRLEADRSSATPGDVGAKILDHELAVRLSYFLWSTMPDDALAELADAGKLSDPAVLDQQITRMLADPRSAALTDQFAAQWLTLGRLRNALPSREVFPALTNSLKDAMDDETRGFFNNLRTNDASILDLIDCDYAFVNEELARHYGIDGVSGKELRRVALRPELHRGGLLGMSSILTLTSHTDRTKPTARGKWILQVILGTPPSPPPADVGNLKEDRADHAPQTIREKLAQHASNPTCAACHRKIDPLGFALENYDAIGTWREHVGDAPVDNVGQLPGGDKFVGVDGLKKVLRQKQDLFIRNLTVQMMTYALGRQTQYQDELAVADIADRLRAEDHRFSALIRGVVTSRPFQYRRCQGPTAQARGNDDPQ